MPKSFGGATELAEIVDAYSSTWSAPEYLLAETCGLEGHIPYLGSKELLPMDARSASYI